MATMNFRCTDEQKDAIEAKAKKYGFNSVGAYIKFTSINANLSATVPTIQKETTSPNPINKNIDNKIKAYKKAYIENYTDYSPQTNEALVEAKNALCAENKNREDVFTIISKMSNITGSNKSKMQALKNEEKYVFEIIELFKV
jgi:hypothetical protein